MESRNSSRAIVAAVVRGTLIQSAVIAGCYLLRLNLATTALLLLPGVVLLAGGAPFAASIVISTFSTASLDYFFIPPVLTWRVADPFDLTALIVFLTTALVISNFASEARSRAREAERRRATLDRLYAAGRTLLRVGPAEGTLQQIAQTFRAAFAVRAVCVYDGENAQGAVDGDSAQLREKTRDAFISSLDRDYPEAAIATRLIHIEGHVAGAIGFESLEDAETTAPGLVALASAAIERRRAFERANHAAAEARAEIFRTALLDALAHEFKTPLAVILAAAGGLLDAENISPRQSGLAEEIESQTLRLSNLTSRLLSKAAADASEVSARMEPLDLHALLEGLIASRSGYEPSRPFVFIHQGPSPPVRADQELLRLALNQLLDNAVKYSQPGSEIVLSLIPEADRVSVEVWNKGDSVPAKDRFRIFERFYRGENGRSQAPGSGLGLYVARHIARTHRGSLVIAESGSGESSTGAEGVCFRLTLPLGGESENAGIGREVAARR